MVTTAAARSLDLPDIDVDVDVDVDVAFDVEDTIRGILELNADGQRQVRKEPLFNCWFLL